MNSKGEISASEISEYEFCNVAWYMDIEGYPRGHGSRVRIENGKEMHAKLDPSFKRVSIGMKLSVILLMSALIALAAVILGIL